MIRFSKRQLEGMRKVMNHQITHNRENQIIHCVQELAELIQALTKIELGVPAYESLYEEFFDAYWTMMQIHKMHVTDIKGTTLFNRIATTKIDRELRRLKL